MKTNPDWPTVRFLNQDCMLNFDRYRNGRLALSLIFRDEDGFMEVMTTASVNLPHAPLNEGEMFIKDWSENEGLLQALIDAGVVRRPLRWVTSGYVEVPAVRLLIMPEVD